MIKKLRKRFIFIAMCSVFAVLFVIIGGIIAVNYSHVVQNAEEKLDIIELFNGTFPMGNDFSEFFIGGRLSPETPFETRYFTVTLNREGEAYEVNTGSISAVNAYQARQIGEKLFFKNKTKGFESNYRYRRVMLHDGCMYIFVDSSRDLENFQSFAWAGIVISLLGFVAVLVPVLFFSRLAIKPVIESNEKQKRFITDASHELKTPLAVISAANDVIEMDNGESEWTHSISNQVKRLSSLTQKLVMLSRMDEEGYKPNKIRFSLSDLCFEAAHSFDAVAASGEKGYRISVEPDIGFEGDESLFTQLVSLLLDNAMKYTNPNGTVEFILKRTGKNIEITVRNTVEEIRKGNLNVLFERFYREDNSRSSKTGGHGIGLSVAKAIVTAHKGKINAYSPDGKTVVFTVLL